MGLCKNKSNCLNNKTKKLKIILDDKNLCNKLRASVSLDYSEETIKRYMKSQIIKDEDDSIDNLVESLYEEFTNSKSGWMFGENCFCLLAYIGVFITAVLAIIDSLGKINDEKLNCITVIATFILLLFSLFINKLTKSNSQKKNRLEVLFVVCNKFLPTLTFLLTFWTCILKICTYNWFWIILIIGTIIFAFVIVIKKFNLYLQVNDDISTIK